MTWVQDEDIYYIYDGSSWDTEIPDEFTIIKSNGVLKIADRIENNIMLLAFYRSVDSGATQYNLMDGIIDEYEDESGIDTGNSTNEDYDSTNDLYSPTSSAGSDIIDQSSGSLGGPLGGAAGGQEYRVAQSFQLDSNYTIAGVSYKLGTNSGSPTGNHTVRIETDNSGVPSGTLADANASKEITPVANSYNTATFDNTFQLSSSTTYWLVILCDNQADNVYWRVLYDSANPYANGMRAYSTDGGSSWTTSGVTSHDHVFKIISAPTADLMTLISESFTAEVAPDDARIVLFEEDVDNITVNTDIKAYVSRDGGTTYTQVTLSDDGDWQTGKRILCGVADISGQPSGTNIRYKVETLNNKDLKLHGVGLNWN